MKIWGKKETIPFRQFMKKENNQTSKIKSYSLIPIPLLNFDWYSFITSPTPFIILGIVVTIPILSSVCSKFFMDTPLEQFFYRFENGLNILYPVVKLGALGVILYYAKVMFL